MDDQNALPAGKLPGEVLKHLLDRYPIRDERVILGPGVGRDTAAISFGEEVLLVKTDPITFVSSRAAHHLVHVNANDIACQGGVPRWLLVTALLPTGSTTAASTAAMFDELNLAAAEIGVSIIGGHTEITVGLDRPILVGAMLGTTHPSRLISPANAGPGDRILMTKTAGIEGAALLANEFHGRLAEVLALETVDRAAAFLVDPGISILAEAAALTDAGAVTALHDPTEGGIATAVRELATATGCGAVISRSAIAVAPETVAMCDALALDPLGLLSSGALLAVVPADQMDVAERALVAIGIEHSWIGKLTPPDAGIQLRLGERYVELPIFAVDEVARLLAERGTA